MADLTTVAGLTAYKATLETRRQEIAGSAASFSTEGFSYDRDAAYRNLIAEINWVKAEIARLNGTAASTSPEVEGIDAGTTSID